MGFVRLLLDTCTFLWLAQQPAMISPTAATAINDPSNDLFLSDTTVLEIVLKYSAGKLPLPGAPNAWIPEKVRFHQLQSLALTREAVYRSGDLPRVHADPFDRLLAAQAIESEMTLISPDAPLSLLGASRIW
jgi:PIN domain nuclease of toxin-antitoxin system